jgi:hypothetical protein
MKTEEIYRRLREVDPASQAEMAELELGAAEADLAEAIPAEPAGKAPVEAATPWPSRDRRHRRGILSLAGAAVAAIAIAVLLLIGGGGASKSPSQAYGAELIRFAESTPLLLLEDPGWRVQNTVEFNAEEGMMEFVTGRPVPYESIRVTGSPTRQRASGMLPPAVRQRRVELRWNQRGLEEAFESARRMPHPHGRHWVEAPVLDTTAQVDTRAEFFVNVGGPGNRQMTAIWPEGGYVLELRAAVPDLAAFEERLGWLEKVDSESWLDAMPAKVVKAADHDAAVREMLKGIPVPAGFDPAQIPDEGLTTDRYQVGGAVTGTVSCLWFRQWGEARRTGDREAAAEAEKAMTTSKRWPILREMAPEGAYPNLIWQLAAAMPSGEWRRGWRLLPHAEGLGCARQGIPVLPWKQRRQEERASGGSTPPA